MKAWMVFAGGGLAGATLLGLAMAGTAHSTTTAEEARIAALEARLAALERTVAVQPTTQVVTVAGPRGLRLTTSQGMQFEATKELTSRGKTWTVTADDEIVLQTGKAKLRMSKSGRIELIGAEIEVKGESNMVLKGSKIGSN